METSTDVIVTTQQKILIQGQFEIRSIEDFVHKNGFNIEKFFPLPGPEGLSIQPPPDELAWTQEEFNKLVEILEKYPNIKII